MISFKQFLEEYALLEHAVPKDLRLRDIHKHLTKRGWSEDRHSGGHKIYTHPTRGTVSVPAHPTATISPGVVRQIYKISEDNVDEVMIPVKHIKTFEKGQSINKIKSLRDVIKSGEKLPNIKVIKRDFGGKNVRFDLLDGHHRLRAHKAEGKTHIDADLYDSKEYK